MATTANLTNLMYYMVGQGLQVSVCVDEDIYATAKTSSDVNKAVNCTAPLDNFTLKSDKGDELTFETNNAGELEAVGCVAPNIAIAQTLISGMFAANL